jgi:hypothetical protein
MILKMKPAKIFGALVGLASFGIFLGFSLNLFNVYPFKEDTTPVLNISSAPTPPDIFTSDYEYVPFETMIKEADVIMAGKVIAIGETRWNQDSGEYWEETFKDGVGETRVSALPYYEITVSVNQLLADSLGVKEDQLIITVIGMSPVDHQAQASTIHPKNGDEIVAFMRQGEISWRSGPVTYNKEEGSLETGRKAAMLLLGGPNNSHLLRDGNGLYYRPSAKDSPVDEQISPMSLEDLTEWVLGYR